MSLQNSDLFLIQDVSDKKFYKLSVKDLLDRVEGGPSVNFRGGVDLAMSPLQNGVDPAVADNGDLYMVTDDAAVIESGWNMLNGETEASAGDRIIWDGPDDAWILIGGGSGGGGIVQSITTASPLEDNGDQVNLVLSILKARTNTEAVNSSDGKGSSGYVQRLAEAGDVAWDTGTGSDEAVVTADLLKATNITINTTTEAIKDGEINFNAGNGLAETGDNATANQEADTTKTFSVNAEDDTLTVASTGVKVNYGNGLHINNNSLEADPGDDTTTVDVDGIKVNFGNGLHINNSALAAKAGDTTITVDGDGIKVNTTDSAFDTPTLQEVTDAGGTTTNSITVGVGDNQIVLDASTGEITGGANAKIDGGTF